MHAIMDDLIEIRHIQGDELKVIVGRLIQTNN